MKNHGLTLLKIGNSFVYITQTEYSNLMVEGIKNYIGTIFNLNKD